MSSCLHQQLMVCRTMLCCTAMKKLCALLIVLLAFNVGQKTLTMLKNNVKTLIPVVTVFGYGKDQGGESIFHTALVWKQH